MSNLQSAKEAVLTELEQARQGVDFYQSRIAELEQVLASLEAIDGGETAGPARKRAARSTQKAAKPAASTRRGAARKSASALPATSKEFWLNLVTGEPQTSRQILDAAVAALEINPSAADLKKLSQRQANALHMLVKDKSIADSGSGRQRTFTR